MKAPAVNVTDGERNAEPDKSRVTRPEVFSTADPLAPGPTTRPRRLREEIGAEIESMALYQLSKGNPISTDAAATLARMETQTLPLADLIQVHNELASTCLAMPRAIRALQDDREFGKASGILGPTPSVRRLTLASIFFAITFFATSLSGRVNVETIVLSIYELEGVDLAVKLLLIMSAAGLGASFAALFDVWNDLNSNRYDPLAESATWMRIGLGVIAGMILAEIVGSEHVIVGDESNLEQPKLPVISDPLLALIGGFSATVLHMMMSSMVEAFRRAFNVEDKNRTLNPQTYDAMLGRLMATVQQDDRALQLDAISDGTAEPSAGPTKRPD